MARRQLAAALGLVVALLWSVPRLTAQRGLEYEVKAAYLYNIVNFVTWPADAFAGPADPLHVCLYGMDPFGAEIDSAMRGGTANMRPVLVRRVDDVRELGECELVFTPGGNTDWMDQVVRATAQRPVLTVGESGDFLRRGGMVAFVIDGGRVRFDVNLNAANAHGLMLSSRLLQVARSVTGKGAAR